MKHLKFLAALCCMLAVFAACEKNEPSDNTNGNDINTDQNDGNSNSGNDTNQNGGNSNTGSDNATGTANGHEYVDLALPSGLKWATCNVGATTPEECGNRYAWGETETKYYYDWSTYKYGSDLYELTKYCTDSDYGKTGFVDQKTVLDPEDDAAHVNWGGAWRMPTYEEWNELLKNCTWTWTDDYNGTGVAGRIVTSHINGNSIFLPVAGYCFYKELNILGGYGYYWSSSLSGRSDRALLVGFYSGYLTCYFYERYYGLSVRPVL